MSIPAQSQSTAPRRPARPVICLATVCDLLNIDGDAALVLIDEGRLTFAWNISAAHNRCREIRVLTECFNAYVENRASAIKTVAQAVEVILPRPSVGKGDPTLRASTIYHRLGCSQGLLVNLIKSGDLKLAPGHRRPPGCSQSYSILHSSASEFLQRRCIGFGAYKK